MIFFMALNKRGKTHANTVHRNKSTTGSHRSVLQRLDNWASGCSAECQLDHKMLLRKDVEEGEGLLCKGP
jgi:hypothetical protein